MTAQSGPAGCDVLFISASVGAGHDSAAKAAKAGLAAQRGDLRTDLWDMMTITPRAFKAFYADGYKMCMTHAPWLWGAGYRLADRPHSQRRGLSEAGRLAFERLMLRKFRRRLLKTKPRLIVHTHFLAPPVVGRLIGAGALNAKQYIVTTDILAHRFWYADNVEQYFVASEQARQTVGSWGIEEKRICLSGVPIHPKWTAPLDRAKLLADWSLPADKKIVVLAGGAQFTTGPVAKMALDLTAARDDVFVVVLTGRNSRLQAQLDATPGPLRGVPMTDRAHELVELCSLMITKAGGITTTECTAKGKAMLFLRPVPGQEEGNARYYVDCGAGVMTNDFAQVARAAAELLGDAERLSNLAERSAGLYRPATQIIVDAIVAQLTPAAPAGLEHSGPSDS